ncbi:MAG: dihydropteroate synthase [Actinomycetota bacterium]
MGVLNVTPDSFSDGGLFLSPETALKQAFQMQLEGADIIDVGGESTRPGAEPVSAAEEIDRVIPVIERISADIDLPISIDTTKAAVAQAAVEAGAVIINDVSAMQFDPGMAAVAARSGAGVVLMHMRGEPRTMQADPMYLNVVGDIKRALLGWAVDAEKAGVAPDSIALDPGIGFGKTLDHNLSLIKAVGFLTTERYALLVGPSRKSFIGAVLDLPVEERLEGTAATVAWLAANGAHIIRVHDVGPMSHVVRMVEAISHAR